MDALDQDSRESRRMNSRSRLLRAQFSVRVQVRQAGLKARLYYGVAPYHFVAPCAPVAYALVAYAPVEADL